MKKYVFGHEMLYINCSILAAKLIAVTLESIGKITTKDSNFIVWAFIDDVHSQGAIVMFVRKKEIGNEQRD